MRPELQTIVEALLTASKASGEVSLDAVGEAIGARAITPEEIDAIMSTLEKQGRKVVTPKGGDGEKRLHAVVAAARALAPELGRKPTVAEIASRAALSTDEVNHALALLKVMQR